MAGGGGGGQQQQGGSDNSLDFLWGIVLVIAVIVGAWYFYRAQIVGAIYFVRYYEIVLIQAILQFYIPIATTLHLPQPDITDLVQAISTINEGPSKEMGFGVVADVSAAVGWYLTIPVAIILGIFALIVFKANITAKFKRIHNMTTLRDSEVQLWDMIAPVAKLDLVNEDINKGPWAMSIPPKMFAEKFGLLEKDLTQHPIKVTVKKGAATRVFSMQLRQQFKGVETMPDHMQAIFAVCAARARRDRATSDSIMKQMSRSAAEGKIDYSGVKEAIAKHINTKEVQYVVRRHAYLLTLMASMIELGRTDGVLATSEFLWVKTIDRPLWYTLNSIGRQTPYTEVSGVYAHWLVEKRLQRPLKIPMVETAVMALEIAIADILFDPEEPEG